MPKKLKEIDTTLNNYDDDVEFLSKKEEKEILYCLESYNQFNNERINHD
jgi:hypothetical protein